MPVEGNAGTRKLITKIKGYSRVLDVRNSITYIPDFISAAQKLIEKRLTGVYNVVNTGTISPYEIMEMYKRVVDSNHTFKRLTLDELKEVAKTGRSNCVLDSAKLSKEGIKMKPVKKALLEALNRMASN